MYFMKIWARGFAPLCGDLSIQITLKVTEAVPKTSWQWLRYSRVLALFINSNFLKRRGL